MKNKSIHSKKQTSLFEQFFSGIYKRWILSRIPQEITRQRLKLMWHIWGYWPLLTLDLLSFGERTKLISRFLKVDWNILHAHRPSEIARICIAIAERPARYEEIMID